MKNNIDPVVCGKRLKECRDNKGWTQERLVAEIMELPENKGKQRSVGQIGYLERGKRPISPEFAQLFSLVFGVCAEYFMGTDGPKTPTEAALYNKNKYEIRKHNKRAKSAKALELFGVKVYGNKHIFEQLKWIDIKEYARMIELDMPDPDISCDELSKFFQENFGAEIVDGKISAFDESVDLSHMYMLMENDAFVTFMSDEALEEFLDDVYVCIEFMIDHHIKQQRLRRRKELKAQRKQED